MTFEDLQKIENRLFIVKEELIEIQQEVTGNGMVFAQDDLEITISSVDDSIKAIAFEKRSIFPDKC